MSFNAPLHPNGTPALVHGDKPILKVDGVYLDLNVGRIDRYSARGELFLSALRLVFVAKQCYGRPFRVFDMPLANIYNEKSPDTSTIELYVKPLYTHIPCDAFLTLKLETDTAKGAQLPFYNALGELRRKLSGQRAAGGNVGYTDPTNPEILYFTED